VTTHLDLDQLADLDEGLLEPTRTEEATEHLAGCAQCRDRRSTLDAVRRSLAAAPPVGPLPPAVADRVDEALRAAALEPADEPADATPVAAPTVMPSPRPATGPRGMRWLQAAAVIVLLLAVGGIGISAFVGSTSSDNAASGGSGDNARALPARSSAGPVAVQRTDTAYTTAHLGTQAQTLLSGGAVAGHAAGGTEAFQLSGTRLSSCLAGLQARQPLAVDLATFDGAPAAVVVDATPQDPGHADVWVVAPSCSRDNAQVLHFLRVPRP
jgi:anti-sigma factor RsiW